MLSASDKKLIREGIWKLTWSKQDCYEHLLQPAGVPWQLVSPYLGKGSINPATGKPYTKYQAGSLIIRGIEESPDGDQVLRRLVEAIAKWEQFHLAGVEIEARAVVEKAKGLLPGFRLRLAEEEQAVARIAAKVEEQQRTRAAEADRQRTDAVAKRRALLLAQYDAMWGSPNRQKRGTDLEYLLQSIFDLDEIPSRRPFKRNDEREQIDGAFTWEGQPILVQVKWQAKRISDDKVEYARSQAARSGAPLFFLAVNGWTPAVVPLLKQNPDKNTMLMNGYELRCVLEGRVTMGTVVERKYEGLRVDGEPFVEVTDD